MTNMEQKHILTFTLRNELFAIDALVVKEIVYLPELTLEEEVPAFIAGAFNLRGKIVHVIDLNLRFGHPQERYRLSDKIIVVETQDVASLPLFGIIVNDVLDVISIPAQEIEEASEHRFIKGEAKVGEEIVMVLDHNNLISSFGGTAVSAVLTGGTPVPPEEEPKLSPDELAVFHERALNLMKEAVEEVEGLVPLAVFSLNGEYYGANLEAIREFSDIRSVTPVPCTPPHIVGDMNLRGDILTLVDIRGLLNIPLKKETAGQKAIVAQLNQLLAGIPVNEVFEVVYLKPSDIRPVPAAVEAVGSEYMKGEAPYGGKMMSILDLQRILTRDELVVEENK